MRYWLDTEFIERPCTIDLISIGIVSQDGREFYRESYEVDWSHASPWVLENVKPHLLREFATSRQQIATDYDWVAFCWLFGSMMELPKGWPMYCRDIKQWADGLGNPDLPEQSGTEHHALADARWNREAWEFLRARSEERP